MPGKAIKKMLKSAKRAAVALGVPEEYLVALKLTLATGRRAFQEAWHTRRWRCGLARLRLPREGVPPPGLLTRETMARSVWNARPGRSAARIAVFSPLPPEETGIAIFSAKFHMADPARYDVIAKIATPEEYIDNLRRQGSRFNAIPYDFYLNEIKPKRNYRARVFVIGNSPFHALAVREAIRTKGESGRYLYLHEALIHGALFTWLEEHGISHKEYLSRWYPEKGTAISELEGQEWNAYCQENGMLGVRPLVTLTGITEIIVNNARCRDLVLADLLPADRNRVRVHQLFLPIEDLSGVEKVSGLVPSGCVLIGSFGAPSPLKGTSKIVEAVQKLNDQGFRCRLLLAGYNVPDYVNTLPDAQRACCITVSGTEDSDFFIRLMASVDIAVQLRLGQHGESSGCVSQILGIGTPLVTNRGFVDLAQEKFCFCTPSQPTVEEIVSAIKEAFAAKSTNVALRRRLFDNYSFRSASRKLCDLIDKNDARKSFRKRILVDATQFDGHGIQRATDALYAELRRERPDVEIVYICRVDADDVSAVPHRKLFVDIGLRDDAIRELVRTEKPDIMHFPFNGNPPADLSCVSSKTNVVSTIHDVIPLRIPEVLKWPPAAVDDFRKSVGVTLDRSQMIFCDSDCTIRDIREIFGSDQSKLHRLYFAPMIDQTEAETAVSIGGPFFLYNGGYCPRKGIGQLVRNFMVLKRQDKLKERLVFTGHPWAWADDLGQEFEEGRSKGWIVELGYVTDAQLLWLFRHATAMVYASAYEGFGLPPLEAMNLGCPALVARTSSLPEVCGDGAFYLENRDDPTEFQNALVQVSTDEQLRKVLIAAGKRQAARFSWSSAVRRFIETTGL